MEKLILFLDYAGTLMFAISGILVAIEKKFDLFGVLILSFVTAIGGGTIRDMLIGTTPVGWMQNPTLIYIIFAAVPIVFLFKSTIRSWRKGTFIFDTIGISLFTILGVEKTLSVGLSPLIAALMGVVSAVFGGVLRDVLANEVPLIFRKEIYAFACVCGAVVYLLSKSILGPELSIAISFLVVLVIRLLSIRFHWELPFFTLSDKLNKKN